MRSYATGGVFDLERIEERPGLTVLSVAGLGVEFLANESGGHRWQRIPPTEKRGRVQTSTITVAVLPEPTELELEIKPGDLEWSTTCAGAKGGQNVNKVETAVIVKHRPTGLTVRCETERSQYRNKQLAMSTLRSRLWAAQKAGLDAERAADRKGQVGSGQRGDKRRTIRVRDDQVKDHITGKRWTYSDYIAGKW